jgi:NADH-quinone oxidoreductase subunit M
MNTLPLLSLLTLLPVVGAIVVLLAPRKSARGIAIGFSTLVLIFTGLLWHSYDAGAGTLQFVEHAAWIPSLAIEYHLAADGFSLLLLVLSAVVTLISLAASTQVTTRTSLYFALVLLLESGLFGTFTALNFFHWFLFWELSLIPAFFLIRLWGGQKRESAATQFFVYTMAGSVTLLLSFLALFLATGSFDFAVLTQMAQQGTLLPAIAAHFHGNPSNWLLLIFWGAFLGFAVKIPIVPFHTWLPDAYTEAPTAITILLTGALSKMGVYGLLRIVLPIFTQQIRWVQPLLLWLAVATIVCAAAAAFAQRDLKRILAYSSINHLGYCVLAIFAVAGSVNPVESSAALAGAALQLFNHGFTASVLFWLVALLEQRSDGKRKINDFGGLRTTTPMLATFFSIAAFSSLGLPGLNGFIGEFLIFKGSFALAAGPSSIAAIGLFITAAFFLTLLQKVFTGPAHERWSGMADLSSAEQIWIAPCVALMFVLGVAPQLVLGLVNGSVSLLVQQIR